MYQAIFTKTKQNTVPVDTWGKEEAFFISILFHFFWHNSNILKIKVLKIRQSNITYFYFFDSIELD